MKEGMEINDELMGFLQTYFVERQLLDSDDSKSEDHKVRDAGVTRIIQKMFIKHQILEFDNIKPILEDVEGAHKLYEAIENREGKEFAKNIFYDSIREVQDFIAGEYGMAPRRKKEHEILAETLEKRYGNNLITSNINRVITKNNSSGQNVENDVSE